MPELYPVGPAMLVGSSSFSTCGAPGLCSVLSRPAGGCPALLGEESSALESADLRLLWRSKSVRASAMDSCNL